MRHTEQLTEMVRVYRERYRLRYGRECLPLDSAAKTALADMIHAYGADNVRELIEFYFKQDGGENGWFKQKGHDILTLKANANQVWGEAAGSEQPKWIVGKDRFGHDIISPDPNCLKGTPYYQKPVPVKT